jgi:hypothetical protein
MSRSHVLYELYNVKTEERMLQTTYNLADNFKNWSKCGKSD